MSLSRRALFGRSAAVAPAPILALVTARGREALVDELGPKAGENPIIAPPQDGEIRISSNENPYGPTGPALEALEGAFNFAGRYPTNVQPNMRDLTEAIAGQFGTAPGNVVLAAGSSELLQNAPHAFTNSEKHLVTASPSYRQPQGVAEYVGAEVRAIPVDAAGKLDLDGMAEAARGAGLIFVCNPNNPTSTVHTASDIRSFVETVRRTSPDTVIHFDEAYHEYVTDPSYESAAELAINTPGVFVSRTFSKCYGMAGIRIGYGVGHPDTMRALSRYSLTFNTNTPGVAAAHAALHDEGFVPRERARNADAKKATVDFFRGAGFEVMDSQTNFIFVNIKRTARSFRDACGERDVRVGRDFPPMNETHARISIGTMEEMNRAIPVFAEVLGVPTNNGGRRQ
jgi:histidinol-phosphate aminotransferase